MVNKKSSVAYVWISTLVIIFALAVLYLSIDKPLTMLDQKLSANMSEPFASTYNRIYNTFSIWPLIIVFGLLFGAVILSTRKSDSETGGFI